MRVREFSALEDKELWDLVRDPVLQRFFRSLEREDFHIVAVQDLLGDIDYVLVPGVEILLDLLLERADRCYLCIGRGICVVTLWWKEHLIEEHGRTLLEALLKVALVAARKRLLAKEVR